MELGDIELDDIELDNMEPDRLEWDINVALDDTRVDLSEDGLFVFHFIGMSLSSSMPYFIAMCNISMSELTPSLSNNRTR